jgi:hypothetical protein
MGMRGVLEGVRSVVEKGGEGVGMGGFGGVMFWE